MILSSDDPIGDCQARHTSEQGRESNKLKRDGAGNPGPVYGQKDQAPDPRPQQNKTRRQTEKSQKTTETEQTKQSNPIAKRQRDRRAKYQKKRSNEGRTKRGQEC